MAREQSENAGNYVGIGAFQLIRRSTYEKIGEHRRLAMEVVDDVKLGKLVKEAGCSSGIAKAGTLVSVYWHAGVRNIIRGTTKNFFATTGFSVPMVCIQMLGLLSLSVMPWLALPFVHGWARVFAGIAVALAICAEGGVAIENGVVAAVCVDASDWGLDFWLDAYAVYDCDFVAGRDFLARDVLPFEGVEARNGVTLQRPVKGFNAEDAEKEQRAQRKRKKIVSVFATHTSNEIQRP